MNVARDLASLLIAASLLGAGGCEQTASERPTLPEPIVPSGLPEPTATVTPWTDDLPTPDATFATGTRVWASRPLPDGLAQIGVFSVETSHSGRYNLTDMRGQRVHGVPAALVHPAAKPGKMTAGDVVLAYTPTGPGVLARVKEITGSGEIEVQFDFGGTTRTLIADHAEPPRSGVQPFAWVSFPRSEGRSRGLVLALDAQWVWLQVGSGHVERVMRADVAALPLPVSSPAPGASVQIYRWASGIQPGVVAEVVEPGLRYRVSLREDGPAYAAFFDAIYPR